MPSKSEATSLSSPGPHQGPSMSCLSSPSGPMIAVVLAGSSGSTAPSFLSSTIERPAARRAAARFSGRTLKVPIQDSYDLDRAGEALQALGTTHTQGKLAIRVA
jgi:hypothetical protein